MNADQPQPFSMESLLKKLDLIVRENDYLRDGLKAIGGMEEEQSETAAALVSIVQARETTNQQIIALYAQMYRDLQSNPMDQLRQIAEILNGAAMTSKPFIQNIAEKMLGLPTDDEDDEDNEDDDD